MTHSDSNARKRYEPWLGMPRVEPSDCASQADNAGGRRLRYTAAVREALAQAMERDSRVFVMGQGVDDPSAMFGCTKDLHVEFGRERSFDTPLAETALMGIAAGAALDGLRPVYFHNRPDFLLLASDQLLNHAAKWRFMFGGEGGGVPLVVWACIGRGWGSAAQHSQALQGFFMHFPGLKVIMPSTPADAKGLLLEAIADPDPVLILEHRRNFSQEGVVGEDTYRVPFGKAVVRRSGKDVTLVAISHMVQEALLAADELAGGGIDAEVLDLRTLRPMDEIGLLDSVGRTGRAVVCDCGWKTGGATAEVAAMLAEKGFAGLRAPVARVACADVPTPAASVLEKAFYPNVATIVAEARRVCAYGASS